MLNRTPQGDISKMLLEFGDAVEHSRAKEVLKEVKKAEAKKKTIPVWEDFQTTRYMTIESIKEKELEIIRVKLPFKGLVYIERQTAIKKGYINE